MRARLLAVPLLLLAAPAAATETLVCALSQHGNGNWIPEVLFVGYEQGADTAVVSDPVILHFNGQPMTANIAADNARRITFAWKLTASDGRHRISAFIYRATYLKGSGRMTISATPAGFSNRFTGQGTCRKETR